MNGLVTLVADHVGILALGCTVLLAVGWGIGRLSREPLSRQRWAELGALGALLWVPLALIPMPRPWQAESAKAAPPALSSRTSVSLGGTAGLTPARGVLADPAVMSSGSVAGGAAHGPALSVPIPSDEASESERSQTELSDLPARGATEAAPSSTRTDATLSRAAPTVTPTVDVRATFAGIWLLGAGLAVAWVILGAVMLSIRLRRTVSAGSELERSLCGGLRVRLRVSRVAVRPFCAGLLQPTVVVPASLLSDRSQLRAVVAHELGHLSQRDPWRRVVWAMALPVLWWHPLFWGARRDAFLMAELVADDLAARDRCAYARQLLRLADSPAGGVPAPRAAIPIFRSATQLTRRIEVLLENDQKFITRSTLLARSGRAAVLAVTAGVLTAAFGAAPVSAQDPGRRVKAPARSTNPAAEDPTPFGRLQDPRGKGHAAEIRRLQDQYVALMQQAQAIQSRLNQLKAARGAGKRGDAQVVVVHAGDSLASIAARHYGSPKEWQRIVRANPGLDPTKLKVGAKLRLPAAGQPKAVDAPVAIDPAEPEPRAVDAPVAIDPARAGVSTSDVAVSDPLRADGAPRESDRGNASRDASGNYGTMQILLQLVELRTQIDTDRRAIERLQPLFEAGRISSKDIEDRQGRLAASEAKYQIVRMMAEGELEDAKLALRQAMDQAEYSYKLREKGFITEREVANNEYKVKRLARRYETLKKALR